MRRRALRMGLLALMAATQVHARPGPPPRLSTEDPVARTDSSYGSGNLGVWFTDRFGLPAYRYEVDQESDPRAQQAELDGDTRAQHQVANDYIVAAAFNHGYTQLWSQARLAQWANRWEPETKHWAGGYGYLNAGGTVVSTLYLDRPADAEFTRELGVGYVRKHVVAAGFEVEQVTYAPFGDDPLLLDDVTITNRRDTPADASWFEYWDVNPYDQTGKVTRGVGQPAWDSASAAFVVAQSGGAVADVAPHSIFAAALDGSVADFETSVAAFFGAGTRALPAAVAANQLNNGLAPPSVPGSTSGTLIVLRTALSLDPGESVTLRYAYGMSRGDQVAPLLAKYRADPAPLATSEQAWAAWVPKADFGRRRAWVARELQWDAYLLRSASVFEEVCGHHTITQGGYYQYDSGLNLGYRSWLHYLLPVTYTDPWLAREILRYSISLQAEIGGHLPYGTGPLCTLSDPFGTSNDFDFYLMAAAAEYGLGSRDTDFFDEPLPFYDTGTLGSAWTHVKRAYDHMESLRGPHGGYVGMTNGDWSDFSAPLLQMTESTLVAAQLAYAYPKLADLAERLGDVAFATVVRARATELRDTLAGEWTGRGWYSRGYGGDRQIGAGVLFGEPQPWALLARIPDRADAGLLVKNMQRYLDGKHAPRIVHGPSRIGTPQSPARNDPDVTEFTAEVGIGDHNAVYVGGVWYDINGWLTWALGELDGVVRNARRLAWDSYTRNTLANHATQFPDHWAGTISVDDTCWTHYSSHPERCGIPLYTTYSGQITEQPTWMVMDAVRLGGFTPTKNGFRIAPRFPFRKFSLRLPRVGIASAKRVLRGYVVPERTEPLELQVKVSGSPDRIRTWVGEQPVEHEVADGFVVFTLPATAGMAADWAVTW